MLFLWRLVVVVLTIIALGAAVLRIADILCCGVLPSGDVIIRYTIGSSLMTIVGAAYVGGWRR